jgi:hypothetical protein
MIVSTIPAPTAVGVMTKPSAPLADAKEKLLCKVISNAPQVSPVQIHFLGNLIGSRVTKPIDMRHHAPFVDANLRHCLQIGFRVPLDTFRQPGNAEG